MFSSIDINKEKCIAEFNAPIATDKELKSYTKIAFKCMSINKLFSVFKE